MVSVCLPSNVLSQYLPFYLGFPYLGRGVSLHGCSSKVQLLLLTLDEVAPPDLEVAPLGPPALAQLLLLGQQNDFCSLPRQTIQYRGDISQCPTSNAEKADIEWFYEDVQDLLELTPKKDILFIIGD